MVISVQWYQEAQSIQCTLVHVAREGAVPQGVPELPVHLIGAWTIFSSWPDMSRLRSSLLLFVGTISEK